MARGREHGKASYHGDRLEYLFSSIAAGKNAGQVHRELLDGLGGQIRGSRSELRVANILTGLEAVTFVQRAQINSADDIAGRDLIVYLAPQIDRPLASVGVQVKSSDDMIWEFRERLLNKLGATKQAEVTDWLRAKGLILINGRAQASLIKKHFYSEVGAIRSIPRS